MWSKLSSVLKPRVVHEDPEPSSSTSADVMTKVFEQHPNLSVFHNDSERMTSPSPPPSPTKSVKRNMFKRMSKAPFKDDNESTRAPSPMIGNPKKVKSPLTLGNGNNSQASLSKLPTETKRPSPARRSSFDMLRPTNDSASRSAATISSGITLRRPSLDMLRFNQDTSNESPNRSATISGGTTLRRPSLDMLRFNQDAPPSNEPSPATPSGDFRFGSVRSILRDPKTPGTGQNVRFFSRDAYKVISPDQSMDAEYQPVIQIQERPSSADTLSHHLSRSNSEGSGTPAMTRASKVRPSVADVFSPMSSVDGPPPLDSANLLGIPPPDFNNLFDMSQTLDMPKMPPGLGFDIEEPKLALDSATDISMTDDGHGDPGARPLTSAMTSTPFKGKGKAKDVPFDVSLDTENIPVDETIFHAKEKSPRFPAPLHDRSQSFSFGQTVFHSMVNSSRSTNSSPNTSAVFSSSDLKPSLLDRSMDPPARTPSKSRSRALSDTVFQSMMRSSPKPPEEDINDEGSADLMLYSASPEQPDPFRANATTYYTPQTMIPVTPPQGAPKHVRKTSKEESIIFSLQTQLTLQTELCGQYETDLRSRDELVEILGKKLSDVEKEEGKRKSVLRTWKKKVQELEKTCRYLEEEVEGSRQNSMERSIMDEASGEALRMLHRQIAVLEREKAEWVKKEDVLKDEVATLEGLVKERSDDVMQLKETLWTRDENERELSRGILDAKEQIEQMGNVSVGLIDEEELKKIVLEREMKNEQERERHRAAEFGWEEERAELLSKVENLEETKASLEADVEDVKAHLASREQEFAVLKAELNAQWDHTEKASEKTDALQSQVLDLEKERDALKADVEELQQKVANMDAEWTESESKKAELEGEIQEVWIYKEELEKEREQLEDQLQQERDHSEDLARALQEREDRITELDQEREFAQENLVRLEEKLRQRDEEVNEYSQRMLARETEAEQLREEMSTQRREHTHAVAEQTRALEEASMREGEARAQLEALVRQHATADIEIKSSADKVTALKEELERMRRKIQVLQQESADKEVKLLQLNKQHQRDKEDLEGMNTALDSKQMELELMKRTHGVRGTGGATPAPASRTGSTHRRDSFNTPSVSRPSSALSDAGSTIGKRRTSADSTSSIAKIPALGKSARANGISSAASSATKRAEGSMGPPLKTRPSLTGVNGTPTPTGRTPAPALNRSSSAKPVAPGIVRGRVNNLEKSASQTKTATATKPMRQSVTSPIGSVFELDEKENVDLSSKPRSMVPTPA